MRLAVIPARGGSKRIPRKNIKPFCGKPMIAWSIEAVFQSQCFDQVIVSTDDEEIAEIAKSLGASVPFMRSAQLSDDYTGTIAVICDSIQKLQLNGVSPDQVCCIYATAPFVQAGDIREGLDLLERTGTDFAFSVTSYEFPIERAIRLTSGGRVRMIHPDHFNSRSQELEVAYHDAGQFYWGLTHAWLEKKPIFSEDAAPVILPRHRVQDIDTPEDWERAEWMFKALRAQA